MGHTPERKRAIAAGVSRARTLQAEHRRCPACDRKDGILTRRRTGRTETGELVTQCRWCEATFTWE